LATFLFYSVVMLDIFVALFLNLFKGHITSATTALIEYTAETTPKGFHFRLAGFNDKLPLLLEKTLEPICRDVKQSVLIEKYWSLSGRYQACTKCVINLSAFKQFAQNFKRRLHIRLYVSGNVSRTIARQLMKLITDKLNTSPSHWMNIQRFKN